MAVAGGNPLGGNGGQVREDRNPDKQKKSSVKTVKTQKFDNGVIDVSIIPYIRHQLIKFTAEGLRPNRRVYFFFDDVNVTEYIMQASEAQLTANNDVAVYNPGFSNNDTIRLSSNTAQTASLIQVGRFYDFDNATPSLRDDAKPRKRKRIIKWVNNSVRFASSENFTTSVSGNTGIVGSVKIRSLETLKDFFQNSSSNTITLPAYTSSVANNYWGINGANAIVLVPKKNKKRSSVVAYIGTGTKGFDNVTQTLYLSNTASSLGLDGGDDGDDWGSNFGGEFYTDDQGQFAGVFSVPAETFRTGDRIFRIIDDPANDPEDSTTRAEYRFTAAGLQETVQDIVIKSPKEKKTPSRPTEPRRDREGRGKDPIAQTFFVDSAEYPNGVFISAVGLYFYNKDEILPVKVQIRPTVNGYPHSYQVLPYAEASLGAEFIATSTDASVETKIKFSAPIYLEPGEYALVVMSDSLNYEVFAAELGSKILGSDRIVSQQPYSGSFFKSQNSSTWDAIQLEDLTFNLYKCVFNTSGSVTFYNKAPSTTIPGDLIYAHIDDLKLPNTSLDYAHSVDGGSTTSSYIPDTNYRDAAGRVTLTPVGGRYRLTATLSTDDRDISPIVYNKSAQVLAIENFIDNADLDRNDISIVDPGYYPGNVNGVLTVKVYDYRGEQTAVTATANVNSSGNIANIVVTAGGSGFINTAVANIAQTAGTTSATLQVASELDPIGGPIQAKYVSRRVTLAEGFNAGDLRVFVTAYKPLGTDILVYYKVKASDDPDSFDNKNYALMKQKTRSSVYSSVNNFEDTIEYEFEPYDALNAISYSTSTTTYTTFNQYALKVALVSNDTSKTPILYDMRAIALPAMST